MLAETMNNFKRRTQNSPLRPERVISPQSFVQTSSNISQRCISKMSPIHLNQTNICSPSKVLSYVSSEHPISAVISPHSKKDGFSKTGFSSVKTTIENSMNGLISMKKNNVETVVMPISSNYPPAEALQSTIIQAINTRRVSFNQTESQPIINTNNIKTTRYHSHPRSSEPVKIVDSKFLANEFKNSLQVLERKRGEEVQEQFKSLKQNASQETGLNQYIIQLLSESTRTKQMIERLMSDNEILLEEKKYLLVIKEEYSILKGSLLPLQNENNILKEQIRVLQREQQAKISQAVTDAEHEHQDLTISILQQEIEMLKTIINSKAANDSEDFHKIINDKDSQIIELHAYNTDLTMKIKELLMELNRFNDERMHMISENDNFRQAANNEIERLHLLVAKNQTNLITEVKYTTIHPEQTAYRTISADAYDTNIQISGGYEEIILGKTPSPARVRTTTTQVLEGVPVTRYTEQYLQSY